LFILLKSADMFPFTLQQLRILQALATEKNFTQAAKMVHLSQPSLSQQIQRLEQKLDLVLIHRERTTLSLTEAGKVLLNYAERMLTVSEECERVLKDFKWEQEMKLRIGCNPSLEYGLVPKVLELFTKDYPQITLEIIFDSTPSILKYILQRKIDIGLVGEEMETELATESIIQKFVEDEILLVGSNFPCVSQKSFLCQQDFFQLPFLTFPSDSIFQKLLDSTLESYQLEIPSFQICLRLNSIEEIKVAVRLGLGVAFLFASTLELESLPVIPLEGGPLTRSLWMVYHSASWDRQAFQCFYLELVRLQAFYFA